MAKPEWGVKRTCQSCATKFYDFGRAPIVCPRCGAPFDPETVLRSRRGRANSVAKPAKPAKPAKGPPGPGAPAPQEGEVEADLDIEIVEGDEVLGDLGEKEDDDVIEDTSELGEDDDMSDVLVAEDEEAE